MKLLIVKMPGMEQHELVARDSNSSQMLLFNLEKIIDFKSKWNWRV